MKRIELIKKYIKNKSVLDIWCVQHSHNASKKEDWLHKKLYDYAKSVKWLDYLQGDVDELKKDWYNIVCWNAENYNLWENFDIIIAWEIIEHLFNVWNFLDANKLHMHKDSVLILTTPNAFCLWNTYRILKRIFNIGNIDNNEHTLWYDIHTLKNVLERRWYEIVEIKTFSPERYSRFLDYIIPKNVKSKIFVVAKLS
jgi:2-polyprenyl-3-methyl-5-hydroxy-6-metoxy-1,4-benzoquinol methylase